LFIGSRLRERVSRKTASDSSFYARKIGTASRTVGDCAPVVTGGKAPSEATVPSPGAGIDQRRRHAHLEAKADPAGERETLLGDQDELYRRPGNDAEAEDDSAAGVIEQVDHGAYRKENAE
jgi:hypothetical protein